MRKSLYSLVLLAALAFAGSGCAITVKSSFLDQAKEKGWTKQQQYVSLHNGYRLKCTTENENGGFDINNCLMPNELATSIFKKRLEDLKDILDYKNKDWAKFIKEFDLRDELEREEKVFKATHDRLRLRDNFSQFKAAMGERGDGGYQSSYYPDQAYNVSKVFVEDVFKAYPFTSTHIEEARKNGSLKEVERFVWSSQRLLDRKEPDPNDPEDPNKFIWRLKEEGVEFVAYKVVTSEKPNNSNIDYAEGTRFSMDKDGIKKESKPALKLFIPNNGYGSVLVIDKDKEGKVGYLLPDFVEKWTEVYSAQSLMDQEVLSMLFFEDQKDQRVKPKDPPPITVEIAPAGKNKVDVWEHNPNGWTVPLKYKNDQGSNFRVSIKIKGSEKRDFNHASPNKQIEHLVKEWDSNGQVKEYFRVKAPFDAANITSVSTYDKRIAIVTNDGDEVVGYITPLNNKFIQDKPFAVSFVEGDQTWYLLDEDGDGKFEKRRQGSK